MNAVGAVGDARPYCLVSFKTLHVYLLTILKQFTPPQSPNGDSFLVPYDFMTHLTFGCNSELRIPNSALILRRSFVTAPIFYLYRHNLR